jgi:hypothetical protein
MIEVKSRRVGGSTYQVPTEIRPSRRHGAGHALDDRICPQASERGMAASLAGELMDAANNAAARQEAGRYPQDGGGQQGVCALPLVTGIGTITQFKF